MPRSATRTGPGIARSPSDHFRMVRISTSKAMEASRWFIPRAAIAARKSSGDTAHNPVAFEDHAGPGQERPQRVQRIGRAERVGKRAVRPKHRQPLRAVGTGGNEADCIGRKGGAGQWLAHALDLGPMGLYVNRDFRSPNNA